MTYSIEILLKERESLIFNLDSIIGEAKTEIENNISDIDKTLNILRNYKQKRIGICAMGLGR